MRIPGREGLRTGKSQTLEFSLEDLFGDVINVLPEGQLQDLLYAAVRLDGALDERLVRAREGGKWKALEEIRLLWDSRPLQDAKDRQIAGIGRSVPVVDPDDRSPGRPGICAEITKRLRADGNDVPHSTVVKRAREIRIRMGLVRLMGCRILGCVFR